MSDRFSRISTKFRQMIYHLKHGIFAPENLVLTIAVCLCLFWTAESITAMTRNWQLSETLASDQKELELLELEVESAELENEYYKTEEYQEIAARKLLKKAYADEKMVYLPENSAAAKTKYSEAESETVVRDYSNFERWILFLFPDA